MTDDKTLQCKSMSDGAFHIPVMIKHEIGTIMSIHHDHSNIYHICDVILYIALLSESAASMVGIMAN